MAHYQTKIAYDGSNYKGFQKQAEVRTIQDSFEIALKKIGWNEGSILAAGRTDTGVHASGQVISFKLDWTHSESDLQAAIARMPTRTSVSYERSGFRLPSLMDVIRTLEPGEAVIADSANGRIFVVKIRPRVTAHGGTTPT